MRTNTIRTVLLAGLVLLAGGVAVAVGTNVSGPAATDGPTAATDATGVATQETNVTARNVTIERLTMRNVTVLDARFETLTLVNTTGENRTNRTFHDVTVQRIEATGFVTDLTVENVSILNGSLAEALVNETGRRLVRPRLIMDLAVVTDRTIHGLVVENATVFVGAAENVSLSAEPTADGANVTDGAAATEGRPALMADTAVVRNFTVTQLTVSGLSLGETPEAEANETTTTTAAGTTATTTTTEVTTTTTTTATTVDDGTAAATTTAANETGETVNVTTTTER